MKFKDRMKHKLNQKIDAWNAIEVSDRVNLIALILLIFLPLLWFSSCVNNEELKRIEFKFELHEKFHD